MVLHQIPCNSFLVDDCQTAIAQHIVCGFCAESPLQYHNNLPSDACHRIAGNVAECNVSVRQLLRRIC
jgi:hypothetical protein